MLVTVGGERVQLISVRQIHKVSVDLKNDSYQILKLLWSSTRFLQPCYDG